MGVWTVKRCYGIDHPEALRIPTPYYQIETTAFYKKDSDIVINSVADLAKYSLLRVRGVKHTINITDGFEQVYDYHYVHKKNAHLVEKVDRVIREMNDSGEMEQLIKNAEKKLFELNGLPFKRAAASPKR